MKVNDIMKKINGARANMPVYLQNGFIRNGFNEPRKAATTDFNDYYYKEKDKTVTSIDLRDGKMIIYYK